MVLIDLVGRSNLKPLKNAEKMGSSNLLPVQKAGGSNLELPGSRNLELLENLQAGQIRVANNDLGALYVTSRIISVCGN